MYNEIQTSENLLTSSAAGSQILCMYLCLFAPVAHCILCLDTCLTLTGNGIVTTLILTTTEIQKKIHFWLISLMLWSNTPASPHLKWKTTSSYCRFSSVVAFRLSSGKLYCLTTCYKSFNFKNTLDGWCSKIIRTVMQSYHLYLLTVFT